MKAKKAVAEMGKEGERAAWNAKKKRSASVAVSEVCQGGGSASVAVGGICPGRGVLPPPPPPPDNPATEVFLISRRILKLRHLC
jgi:hypothetical protein